MALLAPFRPYRVKAILQKPKFDDIGQYLKETIQRTPWSKINAIHLLCGVKPQILGC